MNCDLCQHEREEDSISRVLCIPCAEMIIRLLNCDSVSARNEIYHKNDEQVLMMYRTDIVKLVRSSRAHVLFHGEYNNEQKYFAICRVRRDSGHRIIDVNFSTRHHILAEAINKFESLQEEAANA